MVKLTAADYAITFVVRVQPRAPRSEVADELDGALKIRLAAPPVDGEANEELIRFLARLFDVPRRQVSILSGLTSKNKLIRVEGVTVDEGGKILQAALSG
ncbi:MAG: DUF167 domain-containing protein [Blastocatellia bacterium]